MERREVPGGDRAVGCLGGFQGLLARTTVTALTAGFTASIRRRWASMTSWLEAAWT